MSDEPKAAADKDASTAAPLDAYASSPELVVKDAQPAQINRTEHNAEDGSIVQRRSRWYSSMSALKYISGLSGDDDIRVRDSDRATAISLLIASVLTVMSLLYPPLAPHRLVLVLICDGLVGLMLLFYVANRFGILNTLSPRKALLTWQLMMGAAFIGIFATINLAVAIALVVAQTTIDVGPR